MPSSDHRPNISAVLGPTNTGKTYLAIERMLGHRTGMIGFPLRLLARENYDRVVGIVGARHVALVTGEEKIVPPTARYFLCTVESMPTDRLVEFLAVDEIQLCADPERGHIFTDRLLHARGGAETMFLGAETIRPVLRALVPEADFITRPRFSQLTYNGPRKLTRMRRRSAIVAFTANDVYAIAEQIRRSAGGAAVVLGALSPRTRNAQVEMYQQGEVDYLVATDAIGMGLNMDIAHVAFWRLHKFDGVRRRPLTVAEIAQIAGRAGRHMSDGTFGTLAELGPLSPEMVEAVENHQFEALTSVWWRNSALDFRNLRSLLRDLHAPPPLPVLRLVREAEDHRTLRHLAREDDIAKLATNPDTVRLLWEVCRIPDFRKTMPEAHTRLLANIYRHLAQDEGRLPTSWIADQLVRLDRTDGDIDTLMARIAHTRTWTYVSHQSDWLEDAAHWRDRAREIEDKLSDALHDCLTQRFVDRRSTVLVRSRAKDHLETDIGEDGMVLVEGVQIGHLRGLRFVPDTTATGAERRLLTAAATRGLQLPIARRIAAMDAAPDDAFSFGEDCEILWDGNPIAVLERGREILTPALQIRASSVVAVTMKQRAERRMEQWVAALIAREFGPLIGIDDTGLSAPARGLLFQLREAMGSVPRAAVQAQITTLTPADRRALRAAHVRIGPETVFVPALIKPRVAGLRAKLWTLWHHLSPIAPPAPGRVSVVADDAVPVGFYQAVGYDVLAGQAIRIDILDRFSVEVLMKARKGPFTLSIEMAPLLGVGNDRLAEIVKAMGYRIRNKAEGQEFDPRRRRDVRPSGARSKISPAKSKPHRPRDRVVADSPFSVLARLNLS
jgi:ATP-dependent RNA helicase SUPV3L1/SUV3